MDTKNLLIGIHCLFCVVHEVKISIVAAVRITGLSQLCLTGTVNMSHCRKKKKKIHCIVGEQYWIINQTGTCIWENGFLYCMQDYCGKETIVVKEKVQSKPSFEALIWYFRPEFQPWRKYQCTKIPNCCIVMQMYKLLSHILVLESSTIRSCGYFCNHVL